MKLLNRRPKGKHRGKYIPKSHWECNRCTSDCSCALPYGLRTIIIRPYVDSDHLILSDNPAIKLPRAQILSFSELSGE